MALTGVIKKEKLIELMKDVEELEMERVAEELLEVPTACEKIIRGYEDLSSAECSYIFDTMYEATKENGR